MYASEIYGNSSGIYSLQSPFVQVDDLSWYEGSGDEEYFFIGMGQNYRDLGDDKNTNTTVKAHSDRNSTGIPGEKEHQYPNFSLQTLWSQIQDGFRNWSPLPDFSRTDADISVFFLSQFQIAYGSATYDPWFSATTPNIHIGGDVYQADRTIGTMGCVTQWMICNPALGLCTPATKIMELRNQSIGSVNGQNGLSLNPAQKTTAERIIRSMEQSSPALQLQQLGIRGLYAEEFLSLGSIDGLPNNQWQSEVLGWFQTTLAIIQQSTVSYSFKTLEPDIDPSGYYILEDAHSKGCRDQLARPAGVVQNFSVLGLAIILGVCCLAIVASLVIEPLATYIQRRQHFSGQIARQADDKFHLLRMALPQSDNEEYQWELGSGDIPIMNKDCEYNRPILVDKLAYYPDRDSSSDET
ncbi:hypothetical protein PT974_04730 [Cladobotryum mycophilum]|uniref:Uncharacterized protein n=1 Tax=Cladobotryum mycophilum TaxID=491253 RepID=A0ABR0SPZ7_9HYPO